MEEYLPGPSSEDRRDSAPVGQPQSHGRWTVGRSGCAPRAALRGSKREVGTKHRVAGTRRRCVEPPPAGWPSRRRCLGFASPPPPVVGLQSMSAECGGGGEGLERDDGLGEIVLGMEGVAYA